MISRRLTTIICILCLTMVLGTRSQAAGGPPQVVPEVNWSPIVGSSSINSDDIFPAEILALATAHVSKVPHKYLGDPMGVLGVRIQSSAPNTTVRVSVSMDGLPENTSLEATLPDANTEYEVWPSNRFEARSLASVREPFPATAVFSVYVNGKLDGTQTRTIRVRSVNDVPFQFRLRDGQTQDLSFLFAAFVDENHPWIDGVLSDALKWQAIRQFVGYQGTPQDVFHQVFAIWNVLQRRQVRYSNIARPSGESGSVLSQHVRFLDQTIRTSQANCVDGTVLFASILYKLGMCPVLVMKPGHMFLGFHLDKQSCGTPRDLAFLETTLIGNPGLNVFQRDWKFLNPDTSYLSSESYKQFRQAVNVGNDEFQSVAASLNAHQSGYHLISVARARQAGISPIPRY